MDFNTTIPIYLQIMDNIKNQIIKGELGFGDKISSVREYSKELKVNPTTIQRVYHELELEGLIYTKRGMGFFVSEDSAIIDRMKEEKATLLTKEYIEKMLHMGFNMKQLMDLLQKNMEELG